MQVSHLFGHGGEAVLIAIAHETGERVDIAGGAAGLLGATAMPEISVSFPLWRATCSAVHPTDASTANRWCTTRLPCSFRLGFAPRCVVGALHGVVGHFGFCPLPPSPHSRHLFIPTADR